MTVTKFGYCGFRAIQVLNEIADNLVKNRSRLSRPEPFFPIGLHTLKKEIRQEEKEIKYRYWYSSERIRHSKQFIDGNTRRFKHIILFSKNNLRILTGYLTGHGRLLKHLHRIRMSSEETCRFCELKSKTTAHILLECDAVTRRRLTHLGCMQPKQQTIRKPSSLQASRSS